MRLRAGVARDVPSSPSPADWAAMVRHEGIAVFRPRLRNRMNRADDQSRDAERNCTLMTAQTTLAGGERGLRGFHEHIKLHALFRIERGDFQNVAVAHESDH